MPRGFTLLWKRVGLADSKPTCPPRSPVRHISHCGSKGLARWRTGGQDISQNNPSKPQLLIAAPRLCSPSSIYILRNILSSCPPTHFLIGKIWRTGRRTGQKRSCPPRSPVRQRLFAKPDHPVPDSDPPTGPFGVPDEAFCWHPTPAPEPPAGAISARAAWFVIKRAFGATLTQTGPPRRSAHIP